MSKLSENKTIILVGLFASIIGIFAFFSGKESIYKIFPSKKGENSIKNNYDTNLSTIRLPPIIPDSKDLSPKEKLEYYKKLKKEREVEIQELLRTRVYKNIIVKNNHTNDIYLAVMYGDLIGTYQDDINNWKNVEGWFKIYRNKSIILPIYLPMNSTIVHLAVQDTQGNWFGNNKNEIIVAPADENPDASFWYFGAPGFYIFDEIRPYTKSISFLWDKVSLEESCIKCKIILTEKDFELLAKGSEVRKQLLNPVVRLDEEL
jgi:hypothetical protein